MPDVSELTADNALTALDEWTAQTLWPERRAFVAERIEQAEQEMDATAESDLAERPAAEQLTYVDDIVEQLFDIRRVFPEERYRADVFYCETAVDFLHPLAAIDLSPTAQEQLSKRADFQGPVLGQVAYYLPGQGCYVNGPLLARRAGVSDPRAAVEQPDVFFQAVRAIARTMWGWGFLLDYSLAGKKRRETRSWQAEVAAQLGLAEPAPPHPERTFTQLAEAGWTAWMTEMITQAARRQRMGGWEQPAFSRKDFWQILKEMSGEIVSEAQWLDMLIPTWGALKKLRASHEVGQRRIHRQANRLRAAANRLDPAFQKATGWSCAAWLSRLLLDRVESKVGSFCMPYALLIAHDVDYRAAHVAPDSPQGSVDTRLWLLSYLDEGVKYSISAMAIAAWEELKVSSPVALRQA
jgi:hypothetical protein